MLPPPSSLPPLKTCLYIFLYAVLPLAVIGVLHQGLSALAVLSVPDDMRGRGGGMFTLLALYCIWTPIVIAKVLPRVLPAIRGVSLFIATFLLSWIGAIIFKGAIVGAAVIYAALINTFLFS